jgi:hypothetical protein
MLSIAVCKIGERSIPAWLNRVNQQLLQWRQAKKNLIYAAKRSFSKFLTTVFEGNPENVNRSAVHISGLRNSAWHMLT